MFNTFVKNYNFSFCKFVLFSFVFITLLCVSLIACEKEVEGEVYEGEYAANLETTTGSHTFSVDVPFVFLCTVGGGNLNSVHTFNVSYWFWAQSESVEEVDQLKLVGTWNVFRKFFIIFLNST